MKTYRESNQEVISFHEEKVTSSSMIDSFYDKVSKQDDQILTTSFFSNSEGCVPIFSWIYLNMMYVRSLFLS